VERGLAPLQREHEKRGIEEWGLEKRDSRQDGDDERREKDILAWPCSLMLYPEPLSRRAITSFHFFSEAALTKAMSVCVGNRSPGDVWRL
jgi:hypothetical protein